LDAWDDVVNTNLRGAFVCSQAVGRLMLARGDGAIVNIASIGASMPQPLMGAFSASKAGLLALTRQIALEWGPRGVRCNAISPGLVPTHSGTAVYSVPGVREERAAMVPMRRLGTGQDVGRAVVFLGSSAASYINGTDLVIDGGLTLALIGLLPTVRPDGEIVNALPGQMPQT
jgi:NAD(P)-dependent dehydrogenase (short-subunit alcohol dehydrogenase family)